MATKRVKFAEITEAEERSVQSIIERDEALRNDIGLPPRDRVDLMMDLLAAHHRLPLDFKKLAKADDFTFAHDVGGITRHIDRSNGQLRDCFLPRCALQ